MSESLERKGKKCVQQIVAFVRKSMFGFIIEVHVQEVEGWIRVDMYEPRH